jgi:hypothetical protein
MSQPTKFNYRIGRGEQGVLTYEPYKSILLPLWRFRTVALAKQSSEDLWAKFEEYDQEDDFVGMDMSRKFVQMVFCPFIFLFIIIPILAGSILFRSYYIISHLSCYLRPSIYYQTFSCHLNHSTYNVSQSTLIYQMCKETKLPKTHI